MDEVEKLIKALGDQDDAVRANAVEALVQTGEPAVEPPLSTQRYVGRGLERPYGGGR
jgi:HEAT repeat protein